MGKNFMKLLKVSLLASLWFFSQQSFANICVNTSSNYKMFGSVLRAGALVSGHELAFQTDNFNDYQFFSANSDAELAKQIGQMVTGSCSILLGLFTSRDCLIAGPILKKNKTVGISSSCGHDDINQFSPYLYTIIPSLSEFIDVTAKYLNKTKNLGRVIVIYQPTDVYSAAGFHEFQIKFNKKIIEVPVGSDGQLDLSKFSIAGEQVTIVFFCYPLPSAQILVELSNHNLITKHTKIIGASSWTFDVSVFRPIKAILESSQEVLTTDIIDWNKFKKSEFLIKFYKKFHREPLNIEVLTYDVTQLAINCYKQSTISDNYNSDLFHSCLVRGGHQGVSGRYSFDKQSPFAHRPIYLTNFLDRM
jgi:hypothetical protein